MKNVIGLAAILMILWSLISCKNEPGANITLVPPSHELFDSTGKHPQDKTHLRDESAEELKAIDFFGVKMQGKYEDIVNDIYMLPMLSCVERGDIITKEHNDVMSFSHVVEFCGVPCGMNVRCRMNAANEMSINQITFITSQTDDEIIHKFVLELTKYYGDPDIVDDVEDSYHWYLPNGLAVRARHLHARDGGWTVYFHI